MEKKLFSKYMYPKASFFFYNFYPQNSILRKKKSNYKNNCILDGFLVLLKNEKKKIMYFLRKVVMWPTDFMIKYGWVRNLGYLYIWLYSAIIQIHGWTKKIKNLKSNCLLTDQKLVYLLLYIHIPKVDSNWRHGCFISIFIISTA